MTIASLGLAMTVGRQPFKRLTILGELHPKTESDASNIEKCSSNIQKASSNIEKASSNIEKASSNIDPRFFQMNKTASCCHWGEGNADCFAGARNDAVL